MEGLSRSAIARRLGVSRSTIAIVMRIWRISRPSPRRVPRSRGAGLSRMPVWWIHGCVLISRCHVNSGIPPDGCSIVWLPSRGSLARIRRCSVGSSTGGRSIAPSRKGSWNWRGTRGSARSISVRPGRPSLAWSGTCMCWWSRSHFRICGFAWHCPGRTRQRVCSGLVAVFEMIGRVPRILVFDNATGVGHRFGREVTMTGVFNAFQAHYRIGEVRFSQPVLGS